jgi:hypothetical protein
MRLAFAAGASGSVIGIASGTYAILTSLSNESTLSGVQVILFSSLGLMGAALVKSDMRFAGWMFLASSVWILITAPLAGTSNLLLLYLPAVFVLGAAAVLCLNHPGDEKDPGQKETK